MTLTLHLLCIISGTQAGMAALITHLAASSCAFTWMVIEWLHKGKPTIVGP
jgi:Amt family ammonium transporter